MPGAISRARYGCLGARRRGTLVVSNNNIGKAVGRYVLELVGDAIARTIHARISDALSDPA